MRTPPVRFTIRRIMELVAIIAIALASVRFTAETWSIIVTSLTLAGLGIAVLGTRFHRERVRAFYVGVALAGGAYFFYFTSPTLARGAAEPYQRINQSLITLPVAAAGGCATSFSYCHCSRLMTRQCPHWFREGVEQSGRTLPPPE